MKDVVNSYWGQQQAAEVAGGVNIVSDGGLANVDLTSVEATTVETQPLNEEHS